jgi:hypothetical protein
LVLLSVHNIISAASSSSAAAAAGGGGGGTIVTAEGATAAAGGATVAAETHPLTIRSGQSLCTAANASKILLLYSCLSYEKCTLTTPILNTPSGFSVKKWEVRKKCKPCESKDGLGTANT